MVLIVCVGYASVMAKKYRFIIPYQGGEQEKIISTVFLASIYHSDRQKVPIKYVRYTFVMAKNVIAYPLEALGHWESPVCTSIATSLG